MIDTKEAEIIVNYYTDPLCCWSWAFEPQIRKLRYEYQDILQWNNRMVGMLPDWNTYEDTLNSIYKPMQMGPLWSEAKYISGMPFNVKTWVDNPPKSSYPACQAIKTVEIQSKDASERFLRMLREAVMVDAKDISDKDVLFKVAEELASSVPSFDFDTFKDELLKESTKDLFRKDINDVKLKNIERYPTLMLETEGRKGIRFTGYRPYDELEKAFLQILPENFRKKSIDPEEYKEYWKEITERELKEIK